MIYMHTHMVLVKSVLMIIRKMQKYKKILKRIYTGIPMLMARSVAKITQLQKKNMFMSMLMARSAAKTTQPQSKNTFMLMARSATVSMLIQNFMV